MGPLAPQESRSSVFGTGAANYDLGQVAELPVGSGHKYCKRVTEKHRKLNVCLHLLLGVFSKVSFQSPVQLT